MKTIYVIQDIKTKGYYWCSRTEEGFDASIRKATTFEDEEQAVEEIQKEYLKYLFAGRFSIMP